MKKIFVCVVLLIIFVEIKDHPSIAPYVERIKNSVITDAKSRLKVTDVNELLAKLRALDSKLVTHEMNYVNKYINSFDDAEIFWRANCKNLTLSHSVLTQYAKKEICQTIKPYLNK